MRVAFPGRRLSGTCCITYCFQQTFSRARAWKTRMIRHEDPTIFQYANPFSYCCQSLWAIGCSAGMCLFFPAKEASVPWVARLPWLRLSLIHEYACVVPMVLKLFHDQFHQVYYSAIRRFLIQVHVSGEFLRNAGFRLG